MTDYDVNTPGQKLRAWLPMVGGNTAVGLQVFDPRQPSQLLFNGACENQQLALRVQALLAQGQAERAVKLVQPAIYSNALPSLSYELVAWTLASAGQLEAGLDYADQAIQAATDPVDVARGYYVKGSLYTQANEWGNGINVLEKCLEFVIDRRTTPVPQLIYLLGCCYYTQGLFSEAVYYLTQAFSLNAQNFGAASCLGHIHFHLGHYHQSIKYYESAINLLSSQSTDDRQKGIWLSDYYLHVGIALSQLGRYEGSYCTYLDACTVCSFNPYVLLNLAEHAAKENDVIQMSLYLEEAMPQLKDTADFPKASSLVGELRQAPGFGNYRERVLRLLSTHGFITSTDNKQCLQTDRQPMLASRTLQLRY